MFVYTITNTVNGRVYVGKSVMPATRWTQHKVDSRKGSSPLYRAMRKYGIGAFEFVVVEECSSESESYDAEKRWISRLNSTTDGWGYNQTAGGTGTFQASSATRAKMSAAKKGKKQSPEAVALRAAANTGKVRTEEQKQRQLIGLRKRTAHITPQACWELYSTGMSTRTVGERLGVSAPVIERRLREGGYQLRPAGRARKPSITVEQCWSLYSKGLSLQAVADELGCNSQLVFRRLTHAGFQLRDAVQSHLRLVEKG
jgi:group I intron endonuclease